MWPKTMWPSAVALPVAAKALQWSSCGACGRGSSGSLKTFGSRPVAVASSAESRNSISMSELIADDVDDVEQPALEPGPRGGRAVGDALHLLEVFRIISAEEQGIGERADLIPVALGVLLAALDGEGVEVVDDLGREQLAMLISALIRLALDVEDDPAVLGVAVPLAGPLHAGGVGAILLSRPGWRLGRASRRGGQQEGQCEPSRGPAVPVRHQRLPSRRQAWRVGADCTVPVASSEGPESSGPGSEDRSGLVRSRAGDWP